MSCTVTEVDNGTMDGHNDALARTWNDEFVGLQELIAKNRKKTSKLEYIRVALGSRDMRHPYKILLLPPAIL